VVRPWPRWLLIALCSAGALAAVGLGLHYAVLPVDGGTGDLGSFKTEGFRVLWVLEERPGGLEPGDLIVRAAGKSLDEWLAGASRGAEWNTGGSVDYEIVRAGRALTLELNLRPVPFSAVAARWALQLAIALALLAIGVFIVRKRERDLAAQLLMLFCFFTALQYWGDAYNIQYASIPWGLPFWSHLVYEQVTYSLAVSSMCYFTLVFPVPRLFARRYRRATPVVIFGAPLLAIAAAMLVS
jgi:hypothetical protein